MREHHDESERTLTQADLDALTERLSFHYAVEVQQHASDHDWIRSQRQAAQARKVFWDKMFEHAVKWGILSLLSATFYAIWLGFKTQIFIK